MFPCIYLYLQVYAIFYNFSFQGNYQKEIGSGSSLLFHIHVTNIRFNNIIKSTRTFCYFPFSAETTLNTTVELFFIFIRFYYFAFGLYGQRIFLLLSPTQIIQLLCYEEYRT